jgi:hypothetical protein
MKEIVSAFVIFLRVQLAAMFSSSRKRAAGKKIA